MKFIANNKIYDTDKAELISIIPRPLPPEASFLERFKNRLFPYPHEERLYKTASNNYFLVKKTNDVDAVENLIPYTIEEAQAYVARNYNIKEYEQIFGELEEA